MKKDHYVHVSKHFDLAKYDACNAAEEWEAECEGIATISQLIVVAYSRTQYVIEGSEQWVFVRIPSRKLAKEILQYIKDTEILFI